MEKSIKYREIGNKVVTYRGNRVLKFERTDEGWFSQLTGVTYANLKVLFQAAWFNACLEDVVFLNGI